PGYSTTRKFLNEFSFTGLPEDKVIYLDYCRIISGSFGSNFKKHLYIFLLFFNRTFLLRIAYYNRLFTLSCSLSYEICKTESHYDPSFQCSKNRIWKHYMCKTAFNSYSARN